MDDKLLKLFEKINLDDETRTLFSHSSLSHISKKRDNSKCLFEIKIDKPIEYEIYLKIKKLLSDAFYEIDDVNLKFILDEYTDEELETNVKHIMEYISKEKELFSNCLDNPINIENPLIFMSVGNIVAKKQADLFLNEVNQVLHQLGFNTDYKIKVERSLNEKISEEIQADLNRKIEIPEKEEVAPPEPKKRSYSKRVFREEDDRVILGHLIENSAVTPLRTVPVDINEINALETLKTMEDAIVEARVFGLEVIESRKKPGLRIVTLKITDETDSIYAKMFVDGDEYFEFFSKNVKEGKWYKFRGAIKYDEYAKEITYSVTDINTFEKKEDKRKDEAVEKRVELHAHTMMSQMDGVADEVALVKTAMAFGHRGIAITDHDGCQAFPHVYGEIGKYNKNLKAPYKAMVEELEKKLEGATEEEKTEIENEIAKKKEEMKNLP